MAVAVLGPGCLGDDAQPRPAQGAPRAIAEAVQRLERASVRGDWEALCDEVLTRAARRRAGGPDCLSLTREAAGELRRPSIEITAIRVRGPSARVGVRTRAGGQAAVTEVIELRRADGEWRVEGLGG